MKNKKTIFYLRTDLCDQKLVAGGSVSHTLGVIEGMLQKNYEVIVATSVMAEQLEKLPLKNLKELSFPKKVERFKWKIRCIVSSLFFTLQSMKLIKNERSIDYIYQRYAILNFTGVLVSKLKKVPLILEYNGSEVWIDTFWAKKKIVKLLWLTRFVEWINIRYAHYIVVVSQPLKNELIARGVKGTKILVNPNGVNSNLFNPALLVSERSHLRHQLGIDSFFVFGFIGTFSKWHGIEAMAEMIPSIVKQRPQSHFLLLGDGPLLPYLQNQLRQLIDEKKVTCTGLVAQAEAKKYLAACDAFLSPTQPNADGTPFFGSPTKLFEYLSMERPILASDLEQVAEIVSPAFKMDDLDSELEVTDQIGIVVPPTDNFAFVRAACRLIDLDNKNRARMGLNARTKAIQEYEWQKHVEKIFAYVCSI